MHLEQYIQDFTRAGQPGSSDETGMKQALQLVYKEPESILQGRVQRYLHALTTYRSLFGNQDVIIARAPGRVDLMGSHTDYHQGYVLPMALDKETLLVAGKRDDSRIVLHNTDPHFPAREILLERDIPPSESGSWDNYVKAAIQAFVRKYGASRLTGMNMVVDGQAPFGVPLAAGLSSSSALVVVTAVAISQLQQLTMPPKHLARFCGEAEWYVGTRGGFMDHLTSILNQHGHALFLDCRPIKEGEQETFATDDIALPEGYAVAICNTNVKKEKSASSDYNTRVLETNIGLALLQPHFPQARYLRDIPAETPLDALLPHTVAWDDVSELLGSQTANALLRDHAVEPSATLKIRPRCQHVLSENARVLRSCDSLKAQDMEAFGRLMLESYRSMRDAFEGSCVELDQIIEIALQGPGTIGARVAGAGWGGCAVAIVAADQAAAFQSRVAGAYTEKTGLQAEIFLCQPGQGAGIFPGQALEPNEAQR